MIVCVGRVMDSDISGQRLLWLCVGMFHPSFKISSCVPSVRDKASKWSRFGRGWRCTTRVPTSAEPRRVRYMQEDRGSSGMLSSSVGASSRLDRQSAVTVLSSVDVNTVAN